MKIILLLLLVKCIICQWIDPHDMNTNAKEKYMQRTTLKRSTSTSAINNGEIDIGSEICLSHIKRIVGVLSNSAHLDKSDPGIYHGHIHFHIEPDDLDFLLTLGKTDVTFEKLRRLDRIFSESFRRSSLDTLLYQMESFQLKLYSLIVNTYNIWLLGTICVLYIVYQLFKNEFSFAYIVKYLLMVVIIADYGVRYQYLLEEVTEHNASLTYSSKCDTKKMSWSEWTKFLVSTVDCERRTVSPLDVLLYQVKNLIIIPMHALGTGLGGFGGNLFTNLPWGLNLIMWPLMLIFVIILTVFFMMIITGEGIELNLLHVFKIKFGGTKNTKQESVLTGKTLESLVNRCFHRPMVQNINVLPLEANQPNQANECNDSQQLENPPTTNNKNQPFNDKNKAELCDVNKEKVNTEKHSNVSFDENQSLPELQNRSNNTTTDNDKNKSATTENVENLTGKTAEKVDLKESTNITSNEIESSDCNVKDKSHLDCES